MLNVKNMRIKTKILIPVVTIFAVAFGINVYLAVQDTREAALTAAIDQSRSVIEGLENSRERMGKLWNLDIYNQEKLMSDVQGLFFTVVPIIAALEQGEALAEASDFTFRVPKVSPRNPKNEPNQIELKMLSVLKSDATLKEYWVEDKSINSIRFMKPIKLTQECLACHGSLENSLTGTLTDPLGYKMEGWKAGEIHGGFEIIQPLDGVDAAVNAQLFSSSALALGGLAFITVVVLLLFNTIVNKPLRATVDLLKDVAEGDGDLTQRLVITSEDEVGEVSKWFNIFVDKIHDLILQVKTNASQLSSAVTEIASSAEQSKQGAENQTSKTNEMATSVEEMTSTIVESSQNAASAAESAKKASIAAETGGNVVAETIEGMKAIAKSVTESAQTIGELGKRSEEIGEIISVIDDIADQTNLLALNAAIEAARAGEQGRGFAVVADEVRKLAERTTKATTEIATMIKEIQETTAEAVTSMEEGTKQVEAGSELAGKAGDSLSEIVGVVNEVVSVIEQIATASEEQSSASEEISTNVGSVATIAQESAQGADQMASAAEQLNRQSEELGHLVGQFKLNETVSAKVEVNQN